jgi:hypothetical protein
MNKNTGFFLYDVSGYKKFQSSISNLLSEFKRSKQEYFQEWCETTISNMNDQDSNIRYFNFNLLILCFCYSNF